MRILDLFCSVDAFWQRFEPLWERELLSSRRIAPAGGSKNLPDSSGQSVNKS